MANDSPAIIAAMKLQAERLWPLIKEQQNRFVAGLLAVILSIGLTLLYPQGHSDHDRLGD